MAKPSFDQVAKELRLAELKECLDGKDCSPFFQAAETRFKRNEAGNELLPEPCGQVYALFRLMVDEKEGRLRAQALKDLDGTFDRDSKIVDLWQKVEADCGDDHFVAGHWSLSYHRVWLFNWLLRRYDVRQARKVVGGGGWANNAHLLLLLAVAMIFAVRGFGSLGAHETEGVFFFCGGAYASVLISLAVSFRKKLPHRGEALAVAIHSLIPRLAGAAAVGLLFLASSLEMFPVVLKTKPWWLLALLVAVYGYLLLEMSWRIHPFPRFGRLALHAFDISATALAHSITLTLLAEGALRRMLGCNGEIHAPFLLGESISLVVFVFSIGLVVNLIWAEQPVTEPL